ncbi:hypothetical protein QFZ74_002759 [Streptomyces sp. V3I7]|nr:hypothetical protein [Streptomyces sp. V3I7]
MTPALSAAGGWVNRGEQPTPRGAGGGALGVCIRLTEAGGLPRRVGAFGAEPGRVPIRSTESGTHPVRGRWGWGLRRGRGEARADCTRLTELGLIPQVRGRSPRRDRGRSPGGSHPAKRGHPSRTGVRGRASAEVRDGARGAVRIGQPWAPTPQGCWMRSPGIPAGAGGEAPGRSPIRPTESSAPTRRGTEGFAFSHRVGQAPRGAVQGAEPREGSCRANRVVGGRGEAGSGAEPWGGSCSAGRVGWVGKKGPGSGAQPQGGTARPTGRVGGPSAVARYGHRHATMKR